MNFKQSFRIIFRNKSYSILNILGLAIGIACACLILLWVEDEVTFNDFPKKDRLYAVYQAQKYGDETYTFITAPTPLASILKNEVSGIKDVFRSNWGGPTLFSLGDKMFNERGNFVDTSFFNMMDVQFITGSPETAFASANPVVLTETMAKKFFGNTDPIGQTLRMDNKLDFQVTAIIEDPRKSTFFQYQWLAPFEIVVKMLRDEGWSNVETTWASNWHYDYVELEASADVNAVNEQLKDLFQRKKDPESKDRLFLYPLTKMKLYGDFKDGKPTGSGFIRYVRMFFMIAVIILLIACINFMNLSTARAQKRMLEVGVRKTFGAKKINLIPQFMKESSLITAISLILAVVIIALALPRFNVLVGKELSLHLDNPIHWIGLLLVGLLCSFLAGSYPAFYLSSFPPIDVLRRLKASGGNARIRKVLVIFQFSVSLILIICTTFVYRQIQHAKSRSLGIDIHQTMMASDVKYSPALVQDLLKTGVIENAGFGTDNLISIGSNGGGYDWPGKDETIDPLIHIIQISSGFLPTLGVEFIEGRDYELVSDSSNMYKAIINESFAKILGEEGRLGGHFRQGKTGTYSEIIGIVKDFVFNNMYTVRGAPVRFVYSPEDAQMLFVKFKPGDTQQAIQKTEKVFRGFYPNQLFEYQLMDDIFNNNFRGDLLIGKLAALFAGLAIFISCLGLFGLSAYSAEQRTKEIGIRKVLGASVISIVELLGRSFMALILISFAIAIPLAWWIMHQWLQNYEYRVDESWWVFAGAGLLVILIAIFTVSFQAVKAAIANPVKSIKTAE